MKRALQTRCVGQATHFSCHPLAPPELVYECEEPVRARPSWALKIWTLLNVCGLIWFVVARLIPSLIGWPT